MLRTTASDGIDVRAVDEAAGPARAVAAGRPGADRVLR